MTQIKTITSSAGHRLCYQISEGKDPVVVFLPGYKSDMSGTKATMLKSYCQELGHSCLLFDYSGHGISEGDFIDGSIGRWSEDSVEVIRQVVKDRPVILVGSSMGGWVMLLTALKLKQQIAAMLGIAVAPDFTEDLMWNGFSDEQKARLINEGVIYLPSEYDEPLPVTYAAILDGRNNLLLGSDIDITCPARFIHGMLDVDVPWEVSLKTIDRLKATDVQLRLLKDGDHRLSNDDQLTIIRQMLRELVLKTQVL